MSQDIDHLRLLSIFHYVVAGLAALCSLFPLIHLALGIAIVTGGIEPDGGDAGAAVAGWFFIVFALVWILFGIAFSVLLVIAGRFLSKRRHHTFCLVVAGLSCLFMPFGTVLGVFTIIVLMRESVKALFSAEPGAAGSTA